VNILSGVDLSRRLLQQNSNIGNKDSKTDGKNNLRFTASRTGIKMGDISSPYQRTCDYFSNYL